MDIAVIIENVPVVEHGEYNVEKAIVTTYGYFKPSTVAKAQEIVDGLNKKQPADEEFTNERFEVITLKPHVGKKPDV